MALTDKQIAARLRTAATSLSECAAELEGRSAPAKPVKAPSAAPAKPQAGLAWGAKVSPVFRDRVRWIATTLIFPADDLMACIAWETGRTFSASVVNKAGSGATGLIQFMPDTMFLMKHGLAKYKATARSERIRVGRTYCAELARMTAEDQLNWVYKYLRPWGGKVRNLADLYMTILLPSAVGKPDDYALFTNGVAYRQNAGLDTNKDGKVTKAECAAKLYAMRAEGLRPENVA